MDMSILYEFLGTSLIVYGTAAYGSLFIILACIVVAKSVTLGHLNPAVTLWYYLAGKLDASTATMYILSQLTACFAVFHLTK